MLDELKLIEAITPDILAVLQERYRILRTIYWMQPVGRRTLSESLAMTERVLRSETDILKKLKLIDSSKSGMQLTAYGEEIYTKIGSLMDQLFGMHQTEKRLSEYFGIDRCLIASGDGDRQPKVIAEFGQLLNESLDLLLPDGENTIAVMGGTTMAKVAEELGNLETGKRHNLFVPARGGIGEAVNVQANSVGSVMAMRTNGNYRSLFVPEQLSTNTYEFLLKEPAILDVLNLISQANCVIHSIGRALHMAARRKMSEKEILMLKQKNAVAESFGYFFNEAGAVVYKIPRIGLQLKDLQNVPIIFAIAGGKSKAKAINAYMKNAPKQTWLITDEACANEILKGATL
ncbi:sugar-binding transcriptional regulator [Enterococcus gallinarum]|uniref:sugar-binding transcriptional regulator n=1 Tax=Enterococcus gallinarum TaxID=1353 RepID=UPI0018995848|nr:sugar-binding domain-containing protein [Enterococcus gallinarum]